MPEVTMKQLLEAGVHFGHQRRRWNPKMAQFIFTERNGIFIIDLKKTVENLRQACDAVREVVARQQSVLFVGTKKQARDIIEEAAKSCGMFWVNNRWLGGLLTNFRTIRKSVLRLIELEKLTASETFAQYTKKERSVILHEKTKLEKNLIGVKNMDQLPGLIYIVDVHKEHLAVQEARKMRIPIVAIIDTNCDPDLIDFPIPGNDDAIRSIKLITDQIVASVQEGLALRAEGVIAPAPVLAPVSIEEESMEDLVEKYKDYISEEEEVVDYGTKARTSLGIVEDEKLEEEEKEKAPAGIEKTSAPETTASIDTLASSASSGVTEKPEDSA